MRDVKMDRIDIILVLVLMIFGVVGYDHVVKYHKRSEVYQPIYDTISAQVDNPQYFGEGYDVV